MRPRSIDIRDVSKKEMDACAKRFKLDHAPSVLSFEEPRAFVYPKGFPKPLGEVLLCMYYIRQEARRDGISVKDHRAHLIAHGVLHLLGYDHKQERGARRMERIERKTLNPRS